MPTRHHLRETTFRPSSASALTSLAATGTFLDHLPFADEEPHPSSSPVGVGEVGVIIQLLTLRTIDGKCALEPELGISVAEGRAAAERFIIDGEVLSDATRSTIMEVGPEGERLQRELFGPGSGSSSRVGITALVSLQRRWGAAANGMAPGSPAACRVKPGVVLLGALRLRSPDLRSLGLLFSALDRAATRGLPSADQTSGPCQLDVLSMVGGAVDALPSLASIVRGYESRFLLHPVTAPAVEPWKGARFRLDGRHARRAASQLARISPLEVHPAFCVA